MTRIGGSQFAVAPVGVQATGAVQRQEASGNAGMIMRRRSRLLCPNCRCPLRNDQVRFGLASKKLVQCDHCDQFLRMRYKKSRICDTISVILGGCSLAVLAWTFFDSRLLLHEYWLFGVIGPALVIFVLNAVLKAPQATSQGNTGCPGCGEFICACSPAEKP
jgi:hypothetical protein